MKGSGFFNPRTAGRGVANRAGRETSWKELESDNDDGTDSYIDNGSKTSRRGQLRNLKKTAVNSLKKTISSVRNSSGKNQHKYALLEDDDENKPLTERRGQQKQSKNDHMGRSLTYSDEDESEDVLFEQHDPSPNSELNHRSTKSKSNADSNNNTKVYSNII